MVVPVCEQVLELRSGGLLELTRSDMVVSSRIYLLLSWLSSSLHGHSVGRLRLYANKV